MRTLLLVPFVCVACSAEGPSADPPADAGARDTRSDTVEADAPPPETGADAAAPSDAGFPRGEGIRPAVDRTEPCTSLEVGTFRLAPADDTLAQACLPNYFVWAPLVCGGPRPACTCDASRCLPDETAKVVSGEFCVCLSPCASQVSGARCGPIGSRKCIPVDDWTKKQVFVCGGPG